MSFGNRKREGLRQLLSLAPTIASEGRPQPLRLSSGVPIHRQNAIPPPIARESKRLHPNPGCSFAFLSLHMADNGCLQENSEPCRYPGEEVGKLSICLFIGNIVKLFTEQLRKDGRITICSEGTCRVLECFGAEPRRGLCATVRRPVIALRAVSETPSPLLVCLLQEGAIQWAYAGLKGSKPTYSRSREFSSPP